ncbi:uncharacterized protein LOC110028555 [Phalaenopsis equestris]|uniref:uncharacterized protein LOC110028555 n=1 Tax=Phalaenopsis equestris TaxID=78828 RepID=UPI0009E5CBB4|nr:uncharacterized protein LOC110028555 [Phalaenopsis equestris]
MEGRWSKGVLHLLLLLNLMMCVAVLGLAGWSIDKYIDHNAARQRFRGNIATTYLLMVSLITGVTGVCSAVAGLIHLCAWRGDSLASAVSSALISWAITTLAFGFTCKQMKMRNREPHMKALEAFIIILTATQLVYLIMLHLGIKSRKYGAGYRSYCNARMMMENENRTDAAAAAGADDV